MTFDYPTPATGGEGAFAYLCQPAGPEDRDDAACTGVESADGSIAVPTGVALGSTFDLAYSRGGLAVSLDLQRLPTGIIERAFRSGTYAGFGTRLSAVGAGSGRAYGSGEKAGSVLITVFRVASLQFSRTEASVGWTTIAVTPVDVDGHTLAGTLYCDWETGDPTLLEAGGHARHTTLVGHATGTTTLSVTCGGLTATTSITITNPAAESDAGTDAPLDADIDAGTDASDGGVSDAADEG